MRLDATVELEVNRPLTLEGAMFIETRRTLKKSKKTIIIRKKRKEAKKTWHEMLIECRERIEAKNT